MDLFNISFQSIKPSLVVTNNQTVLVCMKNIEAIPVQRNKCMGFETVVV